MKEIIKHLKYNGVFYSFEDGYIVVFHDSFKEYILSEIYVDNKLYKLKIGFGSKKNIIEDVKISEFINRSKKIKEMRKENIMHILDSI